MESLPIPGKMYFKDFSFDLVTYSVERNSELIGTVQGLPNKGYIHFLINSDVKEGDILTTQTNERFIVRRIDFDTYNGQPELIKAYY